MSYFFSRVVRLAAPIIQYGCLTHCTFEYLGDVVVCSGPSMEPTLYSNNVLLTERVTPRLNRIQRGDIIIAKCPTNPSQHICKRVIGLPGDRIRTTEPVIYNTMIVPRNYKKFRKSNNDQEEKKPLKTDIVVPRGHVWIEGDNVENSADSRYYGPIPQGLIKSRAVVRFWPLTDAKLLF